MVFKSIVNGLLSQVKSSYEGRTHVYVYLGSANCGEAISLPLQDRLSVDSTPQRESRL